MWYEKLTKEDTAELNRLSGLLDLPDLSDYASLQHILHDIYARLLETRGLLRQANKALGGK